ncbi:MAG: alpha/beta hydrolase [Ruminiclostridium sp.]
MSVKYTFLKSVVRMLHVNKMMAEPYDELKRKFKTGKKSPAIPHLTDDEMEICVLKICDNPTLYIRHKKRTAHVGIYLAGGGMLKYPKPSQAKEVLKIAKTSGRDMLLPYYPLCDKYCLLDVYAMLYELYKHMIKKYPAENILLLGGSSGANLALGLISYINEKNEHIGVPGKAYLCSPGTLLLTEKEKKIAAELDKTDLVMSRKATKIIQDGMMAGRTVPDYMKYLQLGDYTGLKDAYLCFGEDEVFAAAGDSIKKRMEECGCNVTYEIGKGMYHCYAMMPFVKEAIPAYERMLKYISV